ncbi:helix-turn-helix domain-containing protein [Budvicia diplopodorum]|uniref:helix-turn-helix domain-containing protein n=1 Tax=Budvicia diplopodorum TaxID=1119056 RepID=UPI001359FB3C|nr:helix-turn-helix transcriptional regulator [Budvicia diplopodorum]
MNKSITVINQFGRSIKPKPDWHTADIIAALHKKGTTLAAVSRLAGLSSSTLANALSRPWPKGESLIASAINVHPSEIWPSRYYDPVTGKLKPRRAKEAIGG